MKNKAEKIDRGHIVKSFINRVTIYPNPGTAETEQSLINNYSRTKILKWDCFGTANNMVVKVTGSHRA